MCVYVCVNTIQQPDSLFFFFSIMDRAPRALLPGKLPIRHPPVLARAHTRSRDVSSQVLQRDARDHPQIRQNLLPVCSEECQRAVGAAGRNPGGETVSPGEARCSGLTCVVCFRR